MSSHNTFSTELYENMLAQADFIKFMTITESTTKDCNARSPRYQLRDSKLRLTDLNEMREFSLFSDLLYFRYLVMIRNSLNCKYSVNMRVFVHTDIYHDLRRLYYSDIIRFYSQTCKYVS